MKSASSPSRWFACWEATGLKTKTKQNKKFCIFFASMLLMSEYVLSCPFLHREVQYIVLQNIATMSIQRKVSVLVENWAVTVFYVDAHECLITSTISKQTGDVRALHEEFLREIHRCNAHQNTKGKKMCILLHMRVWRTQIIQNLFHNL